MNEDRYEIRLGKYGCYFVDLIECEDLTLHQVLQKLNMLEQTTQQLMESKNREIALQKQVTEFKRCHDNSDLRISKMATELEMDREKIKELEKLITDTIEVFRDQYHKRSLILNSNCFDELSEYLEGRFDNCKNIKREKAKLDR